jgi:hypothetical protein
MKPPESHNQADILVEIYSGAGPGCPPKSLDAALRFHFILGGSLCIVASRLFNWLLR